MPPKCACMSTRSSRLSHRDLHVYRHPLEVLEILFLMSSSRSARNGAYVSSFFVLVSTRSDVGCVVRETGEQRLLLTAVHYLVWSSCDSWPSCFIILVCRFAPSTAVIGPRFFHSVVLDFRSFPSLNLGRAHSSSGETAEISGDFTDVTQEIPRFRSASFEGIHARRGFCTLWGSCLELSHFVETMYTAL